MYRLLIVSFVMVCILQGCKSRENIPAKQESTLQQIVIGIIPEQNIFRQFDRYQPLADYLAKKSGVKIMLKVMPKYGNAIVDLASAGVDGAFFGSFTYVLAHARTGAEILVRPEDLDGISMYHGLIFVRKGSGIKTVGDMKGKRFAFVDKGTTAGYLFPVEYFKKAGINDYRAYLREIYFTGTHEDAIYDVLNGKADIGAAKNTVFDRLAAEDDRIKKGLTVLERSPDVPENGLALRKDFDPALKERLRKVLLELDKTPEGQEVLKQFGARRFIGTSDDDYRPVYDFVREINLNIVTFDMSE